MDRLTPLLLTLLMTLSLACGPVAASAPAPLQEIAPATTAPVEPATVVVEPTAAATEPVGDAPAPAAATTVPATPDTTFAATSVDEPPDAAPEAQPEPGADFSGAEAFRHVEALSEGIGSRVAGSDVQAQTHQYLQTQFQQLGYQTELQPFPITAYQDRGSSVTLAGAVGQGISANTLQYSAGGVAEAPLVEVGLGRPEDFEEAGASGNVVLVTRGEIRFADKVEAATNAGAVAVIIANHQPGNFNGSLIDTSSIPAVSISQEDGNTLRQAIRDGGATVRVEVNASTEQSTGYNVIATRPGGPQTLVVGGHIDSVAAGPGANDNASGTAVVLELARVMANRETPFTLQFVGFDAEEIGLIGSAYFVSQLSEEQKQAIVGMINLDMVGVGASSRVGGSDVLVRLAEAAASQQGLDLGQLANGGGSDHASFIRAGIPALFIHRANDPNYHSPNDRAEFVAPANLQIAGQLALDVIAALERGE